MSLQPCVFPFLGVHNTMQKRFIHRNQIKKSNNY